MCQSQLWGSRAGEVSSRGQRDGRSLPPAGQAKGREGASLGSACLAGAAAPGPKGKGREGGKGRAAAYRPTAPLPPSGKRWGRAARLGAVRGRRTASQAAQPFSAACARDPPLSCLVSRQGAGRRRWGAGPKRRCTVRTYTPAAPPSPPHPRCHTNAKAGPAWQLCAEFKILPTYRGDLGKYLLY